MVMDMKDLQDRLDGPPPTPHARNINLDTHIGQAPQRPYALLEDQMRSMVSGYRTVGDLQAALAGAPRPEGLPSGAPNPNEVKEEGGALVRYVVSEDPRELIVKDGSVKERVTFTRRNVALSMEGARAASQNGTPTDYWNGFTWLRDGFKPERDFPVMAKTAGLAGSEPLVFEVDASPSDAAVLRHQVNRMDLAQPPLPVEPSSTSASGPRASAPAGRKEDK